MMKLPSSTRRRRRAAQWLLLCCLAIPLVGCASHGTDVVERGDVIAAIAPPPRGTTLGRPTVRSLGDQLTITGNVRRQTRSSLPWGHVHVRVTAPDGRTAPDVTAPVRGRVSGRFGSSLGTYRATATWAGRPGTRVLVYFHPHEHGAGERCAETPTATGPTNRDGGNPIR